MEESFGQEEKKRAPLEKINLSMMTHCTRLFTMQSSNLLMDQIFSHGCKPQLRSSMISARTRTQLMRNSWYTNHPAEGINILQAKERCLGTPIPHTIYMHYTASITSNSFSLVMIKNFVTKHHTFSSFARLNIDFPLTI